MDNNNITDISITPLTDGVNHINVYSKAKTKLGKELSNFAFIGFESDEGVFASIEAYWYWLQINDLCPKEEKDALAHSYGYFAKDVGRKLRSKYPKSINDRKNFESKILKAIWLKISNNKELKSSFKNSYLPFKHYYSYGNEYSGFKIVEPKDSEFIILFLEKYRKHLNEI